MAKKKKYNDMSTAAGNSVEAPKLPYEPPRPRRYNPPVAIIGCGGISGAHLPAYKEMGLNVVAVCDLIEDRAKARAKEFFPGAKVYTDYKEVLKRDDIEVVDIATHPQDRAYLIPDALKAHKHVLSQKPYVLDLDLGHKFADLADKMNVKLAINQNGRWSPHWSYVRHAIAKGLIGDVSTVHLGCHWNHEWIKNTPFNRVHHIILYDYAIHWFDALSTFMKGATVTSVYSTLKHANKQSAKPPLMGQSIVEFDTGHATLVFDAKTDFDGSDEGIIVGTKGTLRYKGSGLEDQRVTLSNKKGLASPDLKGRWFRQGFMGTMGELLRAIEKNDTPANNAPDNLRGLAMCFAAVVSAESGKPEKVGKIRKAPKTCFVAPE